MFFDGLWMDTKAANAREGVVKEAKDERAKRFSSGPASEGMKVTTAF